MKHGQAFPPMATLESVDVFLSWEHAREANRVKENVEYFESLWRNECDGVTVRKIPEIAHAELVAASDPQRWPEMVDQICQEIEAAQKFEGTPNRQQQGSASSSECSSSAAGMLVEDGDSRTRHR